LLFGDCVRKQDVHRLGGPLDRRILIGACAPEYSTAISAFVVAGVVCGVPQGLAAPKTQ
jgi:hypothetical protein